MKLSDITEKLAPEIAERVEAGMKDWRADVDAQYAERVTEIKALQTSDAEKAELIETLTAEVTEVKARLSDRRTDFAGDLAKAIQEGTERGTQPEKFKGIGAARMVRAVANFKKTGMSPVEFASKHWPNDEAVNKALTAGANDDGGFTIDEELASEVIELLRPASVVRSLNPVIIPLNGNTLRLPRLSTGSTFSWFAEGTDIPNSAPKFAQVTMSPKKGGTLLPISNDLLRRSEYDVDALIRDDLVASIAQGTDVAFIRGTGANVPTGLGNMSGIGTVPSTAVYTLQTVTDEIGTVMQQMLDANVRMIRPGWILEPRTWRYLITVRDGNNNLVFKPEMDSGTLFGFPFRLTSQIPRNLGVGTDETEVYFVDFADVIIGEAMPIQIDVSDTAAYHDGANVQAAFSLDQTVLRALVEVDIQNRHADSIQQITGVLWGT